MADGVSMAKDALPYVAVGIGGGMTRAPYTTIQIIGIVIGAIGGLAALGRWYEAKRANDLNKLKWEYERENKISEEAQTTEETHNRKSEEEDP